MFVGYQITLGYVCCVSRNPGPHAECEGGKSKALSNHRLRKCHCRVSALSAFMSLPQIIPTDRYHLYALMDPPPPPSDPIDPFFGGIPKPDQPITHDWDSYEYPPVIAMEDYWTGSIVNDYRLSSHSSTHAYRSRITGLSAALRAGTCRFTLGCPLRRGNDRWAQTWIGGILLSSGTMATVIIKVFQESRFPRPFVINDGGDRPDREDDKALFSRAAWYSSAEANAYMKLQELQGERYLAMPLCFALTLDLGREIPWSYGFYKVS